ncbi:MAG: hypothetical protein J5I59_00985 [Saprospiraceae bacterium]|nr:hypothetical protein [Saprospiraceae bacterium]
MKKLLWTASFLTFLITATSWAQKVKLDGNVDFLKNVKQVELAYKYDKMGVGKFKDGNEYVAKKTAEYNKKEAGKGDKWAEAWVSDRESRYQPHFEEQLNNYCSKIEFGENVGSDIKMTVETTFTEPGFNIGITRKSASIDLVVTFTDKSGKELATLTIQKVPGRDAFGYDFDTGVRIEEAYAKAGKEIGQFLTKKLK